MNIPKELKIGGLIFEIKESQEIANEGNRWGSTHFKQQKIFLEESEKQQMKEQTLFHEILHLILWNSGLSARFEKKINYLTEEEFVTVISNQLYGILKDNDLLK